MPKNKNKASKPLGATRSKAGPTRWWPVPTAVVLVAIAAVLRPSHAPNASCVDRLHGLDAVVAEMRRNGGDLVRPALLTGLTDNGAARARWTPEFLSREPHGLEPVNAQQRYALAQAGGNTRPGAALPFTLRRFVEEALPAYADSENPPYVFDKTFLKSKGGRRLLRSGAGFKVSPVLDFHKRYGDADDVLAVGGASTGIPFHFHPASWLELVRGRKRWWVAPPGAGLRMDVYASPATSDALAAENDRICAFAQEEGDIVYVPDGYFHAVANAGNWTVAVGQQAPGAAAGGFVDHVARSTRALVAAADAPRDGALAREAVRAVEAALALWPEEPLLHNIRAKVAAAAPEARLDAVALADANYGRNPRSADARFTLLTALYAHAKTSRRGDIERLCLELRAETVAYVAQTLPELEAVAGGAARSKRVAAVEAIMREHGIAYDTP